MFFGISYGEVIVVMVAGLALVGPKELPRVARMAGVATGQAVGYLTKARNKMLQFAQETELTELHKEVQLTLHQLQSIRSELQGGVNFVNPGPLTRRIMPFPSLPPVHAAPPTQLPRTQPAQGAASSQPSPSAHSATSTPNEQWQAQLHALALQHSALQQQLQLLAQQLQQVAAQQQAHQQHSVVQTESLGSIPRQHGSGTDGGPGADFRGRQLQHPQPPSQPVLPAAASDAGSRPGQPTTGEAPLAAQLAFSQAAAAATPAAEVELSALEGLQMSSQSAVPGTAFQPPATEEEAELAAQLAALQEMQQQEWAVEARLAAERRRVALQLSKPSSSKT